MCVCLGADRALQDKYRGEMWGDMVGHIVAAARKFKGDKYYERLLAHKQDKQSTATKQVRTGSMGSGAVFGA